MNEAMLKYVDRIQAGLEALVPQMEERVPQLGEMPALLAKSMRYSLLAGGKRVRPSMLIGAVEMLDGPMDQAVLPACALEMIHTYSLIHDDLPGMDNDSMRRGRPTSHMVFGEGQAILAGDGLLSFAFECMLKNALHYPARALQHLRAMDEIARGAGVSGMVGGQCMDLYAEHNEDWSEELLTYIQHNKTAALFIAALRAGARLSDADEASLQALTEYGTLFGCLFQVVDDILDVQGNADEMGKSVGKDAQSGKLTAVTRYGLEGARKEAERLTEQAMDTLRPFGGDADFFVTLLKDMSHRVR